MVSFACLFCRSILKVVFQINVSVDTPDTSEGVSQEADDTADTVDADESLIEEPSAATGNPVNPETPGTDGASSAVGSTNRGKESTSFLIVH